MVWKFDEQIAPFAVCENSPAGREVRARHSDKRTLSFMLHALQNASAITHLLLPDKWIS
jgi:hypothetical protein